MNRDREHVSMAELVGRLGQKPELQHTADQTPYVQLSIATSESYTSRGGQIQERTEWHRAVAWGELAQKIVTDYDKGQAVVLSGAMRINSYEHDGVKNRTTELHVDKMEPSPDVAVSRQRGATRWTVTGVPFMETFRASLMVHLTARAQLRAGTSCAHLGGARLR